MLRAMVLLGALFFGGKSAVYAVELSARAIAADIELQDCLDVKSSSSKEPTRRLFRPADFYL